MSADVDDYPCFSTFITMIPIDCKITFFFLCLFVHFLVTIIILVNPQATIQKKEWPGILFLRVPHPLINEMPVSFIFAYVRPDSQCYR